MYITKKYNYSLTVDTFAILVEIIQTKLTQAIGSQSNKTHHENSAPTLVSVDAHGAVPLVISGSSGVGTVHGDLVIVGAQSVTVSVRVGVQSTLQRDGGGL